MASEWAWRVGEDDDILHLGDIALGRGGNARRWLAVVARLPGRKYLLLGNHDKLPLVDFKEAGFIVIPEFEHRGVAFTHIPLRADDERALARAPWHTNIHGHTHANAHRPEFDGALIGTRRYVNVCVELTDLKPVRLGNVCPLK